MKQDAFALRGKALENIYFVQAKFERGSCGNMAVHRCAQLSLSNVKDGRVYVKIDGDQLVHALQEPVDYGHSFFATEPCNRGGVLYVPFRLDEMEIKPTSNHGRFLVLKTRFDGGGLSTSFDQCDNQFAFVCDDRDLGEIIGSAMEAIGVPETDQELFVRDILAKMGR